jgi:hypothetical protein
LTGGSEGSADDGVDGRVFVCVGENTGDVMSVEVLIWLEKHIIACNSFGSQGIKVSVFLGCHRASSDAKGPYDTSNAKGNPK